MKKIKQALLITSLTLMLVSVLMLSFEIGFAARPAEGLLINRQHRPAKIKGSDMVVRSAKRAAAEPVPHGIVWQESHAKAGPPEQAVSHEPAENEPAHAPRLGGQTISQINLDQPILAPEQIAQQPDLTTLAAKADPQIENGRLSIPKLGLNTQIVPLPNYGEGWNLGLINQEVALLGNTGRFPLDEKAMVFSGHVIDSWEFGPFFHLNRLMPQDQLSYVYKNQEFIYEVSRLMFVTPDRADLLYQDDGERIILMTCSDYSFASGIFEKRLLVIADLVDVQPVSPNLGLSDENPIYEN